jgi:predicted Zn finger-like uncharacterized protein
MRVVCDNCGAVYKIADSKLSKEVNRATCKRCGHKIIIYKPGSKAAEEAASRTPEEPVAPEGDEERTVIKSVPELKKLVQSQQGVPTIGSLTAELRAISIPGVQPVQAPPAPSLGPHGSVAGPGPIIPELRANPPQPLTPPRAKSTPTPVMPSVGIPPSDSPSTKVYDGPRAASAPPQAPPTPPQGARPLPPLPQKTPLPPAPSGPHPPVPPPGGRITMPRNTGGHGVVPPLPQRPPTGQQPLVPPLPQRPPTGQQPIVPPPPMAPRIAGSATATVARPSQGPNPVLGTVAVLSLIGLAGLICSLFLAAPIDSIAFAAAGFGLTGSLLLAALTDRGAKPSRAPIALIAALLLAGVFFYAHMELSAAPQPTVLAPTLPPVEPPPRIEPDLPDDLPEDLPPEGEGEGELSAAEAEELDRFSDEDVGGLGQRNAPEPTPRATPARRLVEPEATPRPRATPRPTPKPTPTPTGPKRADPRKPDESTTKTATGPSRFVIDTIMKNNATIIRCLKVEQARGADLSGKIYVKFSIAPEGGVSRARVTTSRFAGTALDTCISNEVNALKFPPYEGKSKQITYPLIVE